MKNHVNHEKLADDFLVKEIAPIFGWISTSRNLYNRHS